MEITPLLMKLHFLHQKLIAQGSWYMAEVVAELMRREFDRGDK
jgi:hypothetical protein